MKKSAAAARHAKAPLLALTVGGSPRPVAHSIAASTPQRVVFFASAASTASIHARGPVPAPGERDTRGVLQLLEDRKKPLPADAFLIVQVSEHQLGLCAEAMRSVLMDELAALGPDVPVILDFTAGTKPMSAALAIAGERLHGSSYCYVAPKAGGKSRDKGGLGTTLDGEEQILHLENPRDVAAFGVIDDALFLLADGAFAPAARLLDSSRQALTDGARKKQVQGFLHLAEAWRAWDGFAYAEAAKSFAAARKCAKAIDSCLPAAASARLWEAVESQEKQLALLTNALPIDLARDLIANASRRAAEGCFADAVLRLYGAVEQYARHLLSLRGIADPGKVPASLIPEPLQSNFAGAGLRRSAGFQLGQQAQWQLLEALGEPDAARYAALKLGAKAPGEPGLLAIRNQSILAHGSEPVSKTQYSKLDHAVRKLLHLAADPPPLFPQL